MRSRRFLVSLAATIAFTGAILPLGLAQQPSPRSIPPNTWVNMQAGGVALGQGVGDEGYSTLVYSPGLRKALVFAKYHALELSYGEDQNALLGYDFASNRWDILEVTEDAWSEFLPGVGHDQGNVAVDPRRDLYITRGNMTLHGFTGFQTYIFDLKAGRGKRMTPPQVPNISEGVASAFDSDRGLMLSTTGPSWLYDPDTNRWTEVSPSPPVRGSPGLVYDTKHRLFVMFGGSRSNETWTFDATGRTWRKRTPASPPPGRSAPNMAFDRRNGVTLLVGGFGANDQPMSDTWVYDAGLDTWKSLGVAAPPGTSSHAGNNLTYDSHHGVFLLKDVAHIRNVWAFRYVPSP